MLKVDNNVRKFILTCQIQDGAFGLRPQLESHCGATYCAVEQFQNMRYHKKVVQQNGQY
ncbi:unnamed protein product [Paramecium sonneborni]|uniref:Prenyltransferase alpha-alpha toroid domain-containing protein n=1 Tax=Paramecium sonneborni TaxID=65129 RepID=A0A8S1M0L2_9CILI|nr:unnamed protein product [Paramecium sonneborni]